MKEIIEELIFEGESTSLDYKSEQYKFSGASDHEKSELLKDILAFANAWRRTDAYILIGIKENKGCKAEIVGVTDHIDDAQLQQFVNQKTQRPIDFSYIPFEFEGKQIGIIKIGRQDRPIYLQKNYGKLKQNEVYIRQGSSTAIASPDEISRMGTNLVDAYSKEPKLLFGFADLKHQQMIGNKIGIKTVILNIEDEDKIPDYGDSKVQLKATLGMYMQDSTKNKNYLREYAEYVKERLYVAVVGFYICNDSGGVAIDVNVQLRIFDKSKIISILTKTQLSSTPNKGQQFGIDRTIMTAMTSNVNQIKINRISDYYLVTIKFDKVQPKQTIYSAESLYIGANAITTALVDVTVYSDNLSEPIQDNLSIEIEAENRSVSYKQIIKQAV